MWYAMEQSPWVIIRGEGVATDLGIGTLVDGSANRKYLPANNIRVLSMDPYFERMGVSNYDWTLCSREHPRTKRPCGHMWNPTIRYAYQTTDWKEARFKYYQLTKVYRQDQRDWIDVLAQLKKGEGLGDPKIASILESLRRPLPTLPSGIRPTILHTHRTNTDYENKCEYLKLDGREIVYRATDSASYVERISDGSDRILYFLKRREFLDARK